MALPNDFIRTLKCQSVSNEMTIAVVVLPLPPWQWNTKAAFESSASMCFIAWRIMSKSCRQIRCRVIARYCSTYRWVSFTKKKNAQRIYHESIKSRRFQRIPGVFGQCLLLHRRNTGWCIKTTAVYWQILRATIDKFYYISKREQFQ